MFFQNLSISALKIPASTAGGLARAMAATLPHSGSLLSQLCFDSYRGQSFVFFALILPNSNEDSYEKF